ncbi:MAG: thiamine phosphate synthase [Lachnospiraceae bacterium]|uniref:Thiamine phosphate synthase n=1 Tax=Candidatus Weimeria bifida TaxID=2599074 RepID=A0A6N7J2N2_9FIRM|nr:thiamine phosphate synthase [Candidatus Weimeria bifida]RRF97315.1 MAG: thiamine phosphate synthase [Lachnospiraceae bacterium]
MKVLCITDHELLPIMNIPDIAYREWKKPFLRAIRAMAAERPEAVVIREKLLTGIDYSDLFQSIEKQEKPLGTKLIWHDHFEALKLYLKYHQKREWPDGICFSYKEAGGLSITDLRSIELPFGFTVHNVNELLDAKKNKATFILASNIFPTSCKPGAEPKGPGFLRDVCREFDGEVYALGGIDPSNAMSCIEAGADGVAVRSLCMAKNLKPFHELINM